MASTSSINSNSSGGHAPAPPIRTHSRPNQPPPPPPLPAVPPVPPPRDSSIAITKAAISKHSNIPPPPGATQQTPQSMKPIPTNETGFLSQFEPLFKPIEPPEVFIDPKSKLNRAPPTNQQPII